jgi:hypothetical protein
MDIDFHGYEVMDTICRLGFWEGIGFIEIFDGNTVEREVFKLGQSGSFALPD